MKDGHDRELNSAIRAFCSFSFALRRCAEVQCGSAFNEESWTISADGLRSFSSVNNPIATGSSKRRAAGAGLPETTALPSMADGLTRYLAEIKRFPLLGGDEEFMLAKRWQEHQDPKAAEKLVSAHLRLVAKIAGGYRGYGLPMIDLIAEGNVGLMQALASLIPIKALSFSTYAMWWIRATIQEYILHSWSLVKIGTTAAQKKLFFNLRRLQRGNAGTDKLIISAKTIKDIAGELNVSEQEVIEMSKRLSGPDQSLNTPLKEEGLDQWPDWLVKNEDSSHDIQLMERDQQTKKCSSRSRPAVFKQAEYFMIQERA